MKNDFKTLFLASENAREKQQLVIQKQDAYIAELKAENKSLATSLKNLSQDYDKVLAICDKQQALLDQLFKDTDND